MFKSINDGKLPKRATKYSAGFDVFANEDVVIGAGETKLIGLGIALDIPYDNVIAGGNYDFFKRLKQGGYYLELHIRSSLRVKGLTSLGTGIIDIDYPDEIKMVVHNQYNPNTFFKSNISGEYTINKGDKIGQLILKRHEGYLLPSEYTLDNERIGGFGSTND